METSTTLNSRELSSTAQKKNKYFVNTIIPAPRGGLRRVCGKINEVTFFKVANKLLNFRSRRPQQQHQQPIAQPANSLHNQPPPPTKPSIDTTADNVPRRHHCCGVSCHGATLAKLTDPMRQPNLSSSNRLLALRLCIGQCDLDPLNSSFLMHSTKLPIKKEITRRLVCDIDMM